MMDTMETNVAMEATKWYVRCDSAEEDGYAIVNLTDSEVKAVTKFLDADRIPGIGSFCGSCHLIHHGFDTREEALDAVLDGTVWLYVQ